ncbi:potassium channel family protein [Mycoplasma sp. SG1]|uniref:potassium channel family protein n=1 Tax=Mycoplasma sp. SG1 TaxID=2810348 RepID=UPI0020245FF4|nr:TrkA family potassium uptake protein [Mycoplasma sp. SG1]URM53021.1 TrkA family potassium uptake protein [Mycoplasma sp. SG1]
MKDICVIGVGKFGKHLIETLSELNCNILAIDIDQKKVNDIATKVSKAIVINNISSEVFNDLGLQNFDNVVISVGTNVEASLLTIACLQELGIKNITAKASSFQHYKILSALGIKEIVFPEAESGKNLAYRLVYSKNSEITILNEQYVFAKIAVNNLSIVNIPLQQLDLRRKKRINIIAVDRYDELIFPEPSTELQIADQLLLVLEVGDIEKITSWLNGCNKY